MHTRLGHVSVSLALSRIEAASKANFSEMPWPIETVPRRWRCKQLMKENQMDWKILFLPMIWYFSGVWL